jgi:hypothetical protein
LCAPCAAPPEGGAWGRPRAERARACLPSFPPLEQKFFVECVHLHTLISGPIERRRCVQDRAGDSSVNVCVGINLEG